MLIMQDNEKAILLRETYKLGLNISQRKVDQI